MAILPIETELEGTNKILRARSEEVSDILAPDIQQFVRDMHDTLAHTETGIGLAAPQVGKNLRIFVAAPELGLTQTVFINPVIIKVSGENELMEEGCLSLPGLYGNAPRANALKLEAYNERGRKFKMKADGLIAQLIQHEIGHLDGALFKDIAEHITAVKKK
ncbi:MAG: peptide deformylase [Patescibacteria group bacterium]